MIFHKKWQTETAFYQESNKITEQYLVALVNKAAFMNSLDTTNNHAKAKLTEFIILLYKPRICYIRM